MEVLLALVLIALIFEDRCLKSVPLDLLMLFFLLCFLCDSFSYSYSFGITGALMAGFYFYGLYENKHLLGAADLLIFPFLAGFIPLDLLGPWWIFTSVLMFFQLRLLKQEKTAFFVPLGISWFCIRVFVLIDFL